MKQKIQKNKIGIVVFVILCFTLSSYSLYATETETTRGATIPFSFDFNVTAAEDGEDVVSSLQILFILTIIALAPSLLIMLTSFTRIIIVLRFVRSALGTQQTPSNQILIGLALFLTFFIMSPILQEVNEEALQPYSAGEISQEVALEKGLKPIRQFMFRQFRGNNKEDLQLFLKIAEIDTASVTSLDSIPTEVLIPAFIINELRIAFIYGFVIYIPFIIIDMIVASTLMSMGMMMLPPVMISLPFKLLLFIAADGWNLIIGNLVQSFNT